ESATQTLTTASHKLAEEMYKKASASASAGAGATGGESPNGAKTDEKVVDTEFEEVEKDKKQVRIRRNRTEFRRDADLGLRARPLVRKPHCQNAIFTKAAR